MPALRRRALTITAAVAGALAVPAAAHAATFTVGAGQGACSGEDRACETLALAEGAATAGDTVQLGAGTYEGATITKGLNILGPDARPQTAVLSSPVNFTPTAGDSVLTNVAVITSAASPAVDVQGGSNLDLRDALLISGVSHGLQLANSTRSKVTRSRIFSGGAQGAGIQYIPNSLGAKNLTVDTSILAGGYGIHVISTGAATGTISLSGNRSTAVGSTHAVSLDANQALLGGAIESTFLDSIVQGSVETRSGLLTSTVSSTIDPAKNDVSTPAEQLFVNPASRDYALRFDSPAIGRGSAPSEDITDIDGQPRAKDQPTDLGADEFVSSAPVAKIAPDKAEVRQNAPVTFSAAGSADRDGPLKEFRWTFSDGTSQTTTVPTLTKMFAQDGVGGAAVQVVDSQGTVSEIARTSVKVVDGLAPIVTIDEPTANKSLNIFKTTTRTVTKTVTKNGKKVKQKTKKTTKKRAAIRFRGRAADKSGVTRVAVTIRQISRAATKKKPAAKKPAAKTSTTARRSQAAARCRWLSPSKGLVSRSCSNPVIINAKLDATGVSTTWTYAIPTRRSLTPGTWEIAVIGADATGAVGNSNPNGKVRFRLK